MKQPKHEMPEKYQDLYDNAPIAYFSVGTDGLIHFCNHRAEELVGYAVEELVGQSVVELCADTPQGKKAAAELLKNFRAGETVTDEVLEIQKADGMPVWISLTVNAVKDKHRHIVESRAVVVDITKKKIIEKQISEHCSQLESLVEECTRKLAESEERYSTIMEQGKDGVVIVKDERIVFANKKIAEVSGYTIDEIKESSLEKLIAPESLEIALPRMRQRLAGKAVVPTYEIEFIHKDGKVIPAEINSKRIAYEGGYADLVIVRDISRFKLVQEELRKEKTMAENYLNVAAVIILVLNTEGNVTLINKRGCNILGYDEAEIIGKNWFDHFLPQENINEVKSVFTMLMEGEIELGEYYENPVKTRTGEERFIAWNNVPLRDEKGNSIGTLSSGLDITERKRAEYERLQLEAQLQKAQKMEAIGTLAGGIAHDFNNILFPILGYTELTINAIPDNNIARKNLNEILKAAKRASKLVNQILAFSRQHDQDPKPQEVQIVVKEALRLVRSSLPTTIEIHENIGKDCGPIMADSTRIHQIVMNLCTNAYHAMEETGGVLEVKLSEVELPPDELMNPAMKPGRYLCLKVSDTGHGMDQTIMERMFDPYFTTKEQGKGTGLGLSVVHGIVKTYNGDISVFSEPGKGTVFNVYLPMIKASSDPPETVMKEILPVGNEHILLVDDEQPIVSMEKEMIEGFGYQVTARTSSIEALEAFRVQPDKFDLIITDMTMPNMTGDNLASELLKIRPDIPIIICTGFSEKISKERSDALGIRGFIMKPIAMRELAVKIREVLDDRARKSEDGGPRAEDGRQGQI